MMAIISGWVFALRRQVRHQTHALQRKLLQEAALEKRYRDLIEEANDIILTIDRAGRLLSVNRAAEDMLGQTRDKLVGREITDFAAADKKQAFLKLLEIGWNKNTGQTHELAVVISDGSEAYSRCEQPSTGSGGTSRRGSSQSLATSPNAARPPRNWQNCRRNL